MEHRMTHDEWVDAFNEIADALHGKIVREMQEVVKDGEVIGKVTSIDHGENHLTIRFTLNKVVDDGDS